MTPIEQKLVSQKRLAFPLRNLEFLMRCRHRFSCLHWLGCVFMVFASGSVALGQKPPQIGYLFPPAITAGTESDVRLGGYDFTPDMQWFVWHPDIKLVADDKLGPYLLTPPPYWTGPRAGVAALPIPREVHGTIKVGPSVAAGLVRWQVANANGGSSSGLFYVSRDQELIESPRHESAQLLPAIPLGISGRLSRLTEVDRYEIVAPVDGPIRVELMARRLGSIVNGILEVRDANARLIADFADTRGVDGAVAFEAKQGERYEISIFDADFRGDPAMIYRLFIAPESSLAQSHQRSSQAVDEVGEAPVILTVPSELADARFAGSRLRKYQFASAGNEFFDLRLFSFSEGGRLDLAFRVLTPAGAILVESDDSLGSTDPAAEIRTTDAGLYTIEVRSLTSLQGLPDEHFGLRLEHSPRGFSLVIPQVIAVPVGGKAEFVVQGSRTGGFVGEILLRAEDLPPGVRPFGDWKLAEGAGEVKCQLEADADVSVIASPIRIIGQASPDSGLQQEAQSVIAESIIGNQFAVRSATEARAQSSLCAITMIPPFEVSLLDRTRQRDVPRGSSCLAEFEITRKNGFSGSVLLQMAANQSRYLCGTQGLDVLVPEGVQRVTYPTLTSEWLGTEFTIRMAVQGIAEVADPKGARRFLIKAADAPITMIMEGALMKISSEKVIAPVVPGESFRIPVRVSRSDTFQIPTEVSLEAPPEIVDLIQCESCRLKAQENAGFLEVSTNPDRRLSGSWTFTITARSLKDDRWPVVSRTETTVLFE